MPAITAISPTRKAMILKYIFCTPVDKTVMELLVKKSSYSFFPSPVFYVFFMGKVNKKFDNQGKRYSIKQKLDVHNNLNLASGFVWLRLE